MCVVSMVGDHYRDKWAPKFPDDGVPYTPYNPWPAITPVSRQEFDDLKREVKEMIALLKRAKKYDEDNNEKDCEIADKMDFLRRVAKSVGIDFDKALENKIVKTVKAAKKARVL